jgi:PKD repeat protein
MTQPTMDTPSARPRGRHRSSGQSLVELALITPIMLVFLLITIDLGRLLYSQITITNAAKEGALVASQGGTFQTGQGCGDANTIMCGVLTEAEGGFVEIDEARVTVAPALCDKNAMYPATGAPPTVSVSVQAPFRILTPIISNVIGTNLLLASTAEAQCLVVPRVAYPGLPAPVALFTATPTSGAAPLTVAVDATASYSTGATISGYAWSFGASGVSASKTYTTDGTYTISLTVTDSRGLVDTSDPVTITVGGGAPSCPTVSFTATSNANGGHPHRMNLAATLSPTSSGWSWAWTGAITGSGQNLSNVDFPSSGQHVVTVTATKGSCVVTTTQTVTAP